MMEMLQQIYAMLVDIRNMLAEIKQLLMTLVASKGVKQ